jgi:ComF family protein
MSLLPTRSAVSAPAVVRRFAGRVLDVILPPLCLRCGAVVDAAGSLCVSCWRGLSFIAPPRCDACGLPFEVDIGAPALCGACSVRRPPFERARAVFVYDEHSRRLVLAFKHGDRTDAAPAFASWMVRAGADVLADVELIVPVPVHWTRLFLRRYNQAALLAREIARLRGLAFVPDALLRRRRTPMLAHKGALERRRLLQGAIVVPPRRADRVRGRRVLLVDDVHTTGATLTACTRALLHADAAAVDVLTLARTVRATP